MQKLYIHPYLRGVHMGLNSSARARHLNTPAFARVTVQNGPVQVVPSQETFSLAAQKRLEAIRAVLGRRWSSSNIRATRNG
jgi:hypothetical protein